MKVDTFRSLAIAPLVLLHLLAPGANAVPYLHVLMVIDTNAQGNVGELTTISRDNMKKAVLEPISALGQLGFVRVLEAGKVTQADIIQYFKDLPVWKKKDRSGRVLGGYDRGDTVLFYYNGHGANVQGQHVLTLANQDNVPRRIIEREMGALNPRLTVILTDSCAKAREVGVPVAAQQPDSAAVKKLFFGYDGKVNINAAKPDTFAYIGKGTGGVFTYAFTLEVRQRPANIRQLSWHSVMGEVDKTVSIMTAQLEQPQESGTAIDVNPR